MKHINNVAPISSSDRLKPTKRPKKFVGPRSSADQPFDFEDEIEDCVMTQEGGLMTQDGSVKNHEALKKGTCVRNMKSREEISRKPCCSCFENILGVTCKILWYFRILIVIGTKLLLLL